MTELSHKILKPLQEFLSKDKHIEWTEAEAPVSRLVKSPSIRKRIRSVNPPPQEEEEPHPRDSLEGMSFTTTSHRLKMPGTPVYRAGLVISAPVFLLHQDCRRHATSRRRWRRTGQATSATVLRRGSEFASIKER